MSFLCLQIHLAIVAILNQTDSKPELFADVGPVITFWKFF